MLLKVGGAGLDDAGGALSRVACSTGSKPGLMHGGTGIRTRGPGTAAGLRFSSFHRIDATRRVVGYKTSRENLPKLAFESSAGDSSLVFGPEFGMADTSPSVGFSSRACDLWMRPAVVLD
jgi:hypothetical protein